MEFEYWYPEKPKLLLLGQPLFRRLDQNRAWVAELKYNGSRLQLHIKDGDVQFWNRHGERFASRFIPRPETVEAIREAVPKRGYFLFDGELRHFKTKGVRDKVVLYDTFIWAGDLLNKAAFAIRRQLLECLEISEGGPLTFAEQHKTGFEELFHEAIKDEEIEGLVIKNLTGLLNLGRKRGLDSNWMFKVRKQTGRHRH
jgi:ATP-dependent DNA ligase